MPFRTKNLNPFMGNIIKILTHENLFVRKYGIDAVRKLSYYQKNHAADVMSGLVAAMANKNQVTSELLKATSSAIESCGAKDFAEVPCSTTSALVLNLSKILESDDSTLVKGAANTMRALSGKISSQQLEHEVFRLFPEDYEITSSEEEVFLLGKGFAKDLEEARAEGEI